jgi:hypothetical protein
MDGLVFLITVSACDPHVIRLDDSTQGVLGEPVAVGRSDRI